MKTKYIQIRHLDYFDALYEVLGNSIDNLTSVEFTITNDKLGEENYFAMDFYNLHEAKDANLIKDEKSKHLCNLLIANEIDFFIMNAYFPAPEVSYSPEDLKGTTIFTKKNPTTPYYIHLYLNESEPFTQKNIIKWLEKLSPTLFGEQFKFEMGEIELEKDTISRCTKEFEENGKPYFIKSNADGFLTYKYLGWSEFKLGDFIGEVSGMTNFPLDMADGLITALRDTPPVAIGFDEEGAEFTLLLDFYDRVSIIAYFDDEVKLYKCNITHKKLADMFLNDMARDFEKYVNDEYFYGFSKGEKDSFRNELLSKLNEIETLIKNSK